MVAVRDDLDDMAKRYPGLRMPVGIFFGTADHILRIEVQGEPMVAAVPGLVLDIVEGDGHMLPVTADGAHRALHRGAWPARSSAAPPATTSPAERLTFIPAPGKPGAFPYVTDPTAVTLRRKREFPLFPSRHHSAIYPAVYVNLIL